MYYHKRNQFEYVIAVISRTNKGKRRIEADIGFFVKIKKDSNLNLLPRFSHRLYKLFVPTFKRRCLLQIGGSECILAKVIGSSFSNKY